MKYTKKCSDENGVRFCGISIASRRPHTFNPILMNYTLSIQDGNDTLLDKRFKLSKRFSRNSDGNFDDIEDGYEWTSQDTSEQNRKLSEAKSLKISIKISFLATKLLD